MAVSEYLDSLTDYAVECLRISEEHGFYCPDAITGELPYDLVRDGSISLVDLTLSKLALVHSEVSEMVEAAREGNYKLFAEEMADVFIRLFHMAGAMDIDIEGEIRAKMEKNEARPYKHGKLA